MHAGVGNKWVDTARRRFTTSYGVSFTNREEEEPDPEKDRHFTGGRLGWEDKEQFNAGTSFDNKFATNVNLSDPADFSINTTSALTVSVVSHVSLKVSLQWLYENEPALESDLDVIAFVEVVDPDGIPGRRRGLPDVVIRRVEAGTRLCGRAEGQAGYHLPHGACHQVLRIANRRRKPMHEGVKSGIRFGSALATTISLIKMELILAMIGRRAFMV